MVKVDGWHGLMDAIDRGVQVRNHPSMSMDIYMFIDDPGVYFSAHGDKIDPELARAAGFDVDDQSRRQQIKQALKKASDEVLARFGEAKVATVLEREGFKIIDLGLGRHNVLAPDGDLLNKAPLPLEQAKILLDHLAPKKVEEKVKK